MRNTVYLSLVVSFIILTFVIVVGQSAYVPRPDKVHFGRVVYPRRWGQWCAEDNECGIGFCQHNRRKGLCRDCGTGYCEHNEQKSRCGRCPSRRQINKSC